MRLVQILVFALVLAACGSTGAQPSGNTASAATVPSATALPEGTKQPMPYETPAQIDSVEVQIAESHPVQVFAQVKGTLGDGCTSLGTISQKRNTNTIEVTVLANHTGAEVCTMIAQIIDKNIALEGDFPAGQYVVRVNGVEKQFSVS